jgi:hypothetical protein
VLYILESTEAYHNLRETNVVAKWEDTTPEVLIERYAIGFPLESTLHTFFDRNDNFKGDIIPGDTYRVRIGTNNVSKFFPKK